MGLVIVKLTKQTLIFDEGAFLSLMMMHKDIYLAARQRGKWHNRTQTEIAREKREEIKNQEGGLFMRY